MSKQISASIFTPDMRRVLFAKPTKESGEREGRYQRLCGVPREFVVENFKNDLRYKDMLRGYDRSEEEWQKLRPSAK